MKRLVLLLITLITLSNISFASFPIIEDDLQIEVCEQEVPPTTNHSKFSYYPLLSFLSSLFGYFMIVVTFAAAYGGSASAGIFLVITIAAMLGGVVLGAIGLSREKWWSIFGFLLGLIGFLLVIGSS